MKSSRSFAVATVDRAEVSIDVAGELCEQVSEAISAVLILMALVWAQRALLLATLQELFSLESPQGIVQRHNCKPNEFKSLYFLLAQQMKAVGAIMAQSRL